MRADARLIAFWLVSLWATATQPVVADEGDAKLVPINANYQGLTYAQWSARHWQWLFSLPAAAHPLLDTANASAGQTGSVWFLGGTFAAVETTPGVIVGQANRNIVIPTGKSVFFPLVSVEFSTIEGNGATENELRSQANFFANFIAPGSLFLIIDGKPVTNLHRQRVASPLFQFGPLPQDNILQLFGYAAPAGATSPSVSDGYFAMLKPLSRGVHTLHFGGSLDLSSIGGPLFTQDIRYTITVKSNKKGDHDDDD